MAISTKKAAVVVLALAAGVVGTLGVQMSRDTQQRAAPVRSDGRLAFKDAEIASLRRQLDDARKPAPQIAKPVAGSAPNAEAPRNPGYLQQGEVWRQLVFRLDPVKRGAAWAAVRAALVSGDSEARRAALWTIAFTSHVNLVRGGLVAEIEALLDSSDPATRLEAWNARLALANVERTTGTGPGVDDAMRERLRQETLAGPPETRGRVLSALLKASGYKVEGATEELVLQLLDDPASRTAVLNSLGRTRILPDSVTAKLHSIVRADPDVAATVIRRLRHTDKKSRETIDYLLESAVLGVEGALAALRVGVPIAERERVARRLRDLFAARIHPIVRSEVVRAIGAQGDVSLGELSSRDWLTQLRDDEQEQTGVRFSATVALRNMNRRKKSPRR